MEKEEILEKSRKENGNKDFSEIDVINKSSKTAFLAGALLCMLISILDWNINKRVNWACWTVDFAMLGTFTLVKYVRLRHPKELILAVIELLLFLFFACGYVFSLVSAG